MPWRRGRRSPAGGASGPWEQRAPREVGKEEESFVLLSLSFLVFVAGRRERKKRKKNERAIDAFFPTSLFSFLLSSTRLARARETDAEDPSLALSYAPLTAPPSHQCSRRRRCPLPQRACSPRSRQRLPLSPTTLPRGTLCRPPASRGRRLSCSPYLTA